MSVEIVPFCGATNVQMLLCLDNSSTFRTKLLLASTCYTDKKQWENVHSNAIQPLFSIKGAYDSKFRFVPRCVLSFCYRDAVVGHA